MGTTTDYIDAEAEAAVDRFIEKLQAAGIDVRNEDTDVDSADPADWAAAAVIAWWERQQAAAPTASGQEEASK